MQVVIAIEDEGQVKNLKLLDAKRPELGQRRRQHLHGTQLQRLHFFLVFVQCRIGIDLDLDLALGQLVGLLGEHLGRFALRSIGRDNVAELDNDRLLCINRQRHGSGKQTDQQLGNFHILSSRCGSPD